MEKETIINSLQKQNNSILNKYISSADTQNIEKHTAIKNILEQKNAFDKIDCATALNILIDILQDKNKALETYKALLLND